MQIKDRVHITFHDCKNISYFTLNFSLKWVLSLLLAVRHIERQLCAKVFVQIFRSGIIVKGYDELASYLLSTEFNSDQIDELMASPSEAKTKMNHCCLKTTSVSFHRALCKHHFMNRYIPVMVHYI